MKYKIEPLNMGESQSILIGSGISVVEVETRIVHGVRNPWRGAIVFCEAPEDWFHSEPP